MGKELKVKSVYFVLYSWYPPTFLQVIIKESKSQENSLMIGNVIILMWECVDKESKSQESSLMIEYVRIRV